MKADYDSQPIRLSGKIGLIRDLFARQHFPLNLSGTFSDTTVKVAGAIDDLPNLTGIDLKIDAAGQDLSEIGPIIGQELPKTDQFTLKGRLTGSAKALSLKKAQGNASRGSLQFTASGAVKDLLTLSGIDLHCRLTGQDLAEFGVVIQDELPATDEFEIQGRLIGSTDALGLKVARGSARRGSLQFTANGAAKDLLTLRGMDLNSSLKGENLEEFGEIIGEKLPATDEFAIEGRLTGSAKALSLKNVQGSAKQGSLRVAMNGDVRDLIAFSGLNLQIKGAGKSLTEIGRIIDIELPATDEFAVQGRLTGSTRGLSLLDARGSAERGGVNLAVNGGVEELLALNGINLELKASGKELAEIGPVVGTEMPELGPFDANGKVSGSLKSFSIDDFTAIVDKSDFKGMAKVDFLKRPKISAHLESSVIDFTALIKSLEKDQQETANKDRQKHRLFFDEALPFDVFKKVDADILLEARNIHAKDARFESGHLTLKLEDQNFSIDKLEATYKETKISGNLQINAGAPSLVSTHFLVQNFNLGEFLKETGKSDKVRAIVDIAAHGTSRGDSVHSLMANLDGSIGAVMGEGYLTKYLDILSVDLSQKVISFWGRHEKADQIQCVVVQFDIKNGVAVSQAFVFNTQAGIVAGEGEINLGTEQISFLLAPQSAHPSLSLSTKLRVSGTIMDPKVSPDKIALASEGAKSLSVLAVGPIGLLTPFVHLGANKKHPCDVQSIGQLGLNTPDRK
jgi:uncharacterized protein involved in outer membrane biogenesis